MIPVRLNLSGFLSYRQPVELDFEAFDLACISGANGAGKSSILDAITWALFGKTRSKDDSFINSSGDKAQVVFEFSYENDLYRIQRIKERGKTNILEFQVRAGDDHWVPLTEHTYSETQNRIQQVLRLDYETFVNASFFLQGKADNFAQQNPTNRKMILSNVLGLEVWEEYKKKAAETRMTIERELGVIDLSLADIEKELAQEEARKTKLQQTRQQLAEAERTRQEREAAFEILRKQAQVLQEQKRLVDLLERNYQAECEKEEQQLAYLNERVAQQKALQAMLDQAAAITTRYEDWQRLKAELEAYNQLAGNFHEVQVRRNAPMMIIGKEAAKLQQELDSLLKQQQKLDHDYEQIPDLDARLAEHAAQLAANLAELENRSALELRVQGLKELRSAREGENKHLHESANQAKERKAQLQEANEPVCPTCGQALPAEEREKLIQELTRNVEDFRGRWQANKDEINKLLAEVKTGEAQLNAIKSMDGEYRQLERSIGLLEAQRNKILEAQEEWADQPVKRLAQVRQILEQEAYAPEARAQLAEIDREAAALGYDSAAHDRTRAAELEGRISEQAWLDLQKAGASLTTLSHELENLQTQQAAQQKEVVRCQQEYESAAEKYAADTAGQADLVEGEQALMRVREQENILRQQLGQAQQLVDVLKQMKQRKTMLTKQRETLARKAGQYKTLEKAFGKDGVPALLIEQALPEIEEQTNAILNLLTDGSMQVRYATQKDYKDKKRSDKRETLDIMISDAGGSQREYELFSGGEMFRVNFATRLALSRVLARRAGSRLQTLVIDEGFGSQDAEGRQRLLEAINLVRHDFAKVLVITHLEELKDAFPARIEVEKTPAGSQIKVLVA